MKLFRVKNSNLNTHHRTGGVYFIALNFERYDTGWLIYKETDLELTRIYIFGKIWTPFVVVGDNLSGEKLLGD